MIDTGAAIEYDGLYQRYLHSLVDTLRGFSSGIEGLEFWVPNEDPQVSLAHMLDAAASEGRRELRVRFGPESAPKMKPPAVDALAAQYGRSRVWVTAGALLVEVEELHARAVAAPEAGGQVAPREVPAPDPAARPAPAAPPRVVARGDCYRQALRETAGPPQREGLASEPPAAGGEPVEVEEDGLRLQLHVDRASHTVLQARFAGAGDPEARALFERFCAVVEGLPLLEAAQHGVIRLEFLLRDRTQGPPVPGIVTPAAADPRFDLPQRLVRAALTDYRARTGYAETENRYDRPLADRWRAAATPERLQQLREVLDRLARAQGWAPEQVEVAAIEHQVRVVMVLDPALSRVAQGRALLIFERAIQEEIDPRLEVYAEERKDRNKLRRLAVVREQS